MPDSTDNPPGSATESQVIGGAFTERQTPLSSSVDPPGYPVNTTTDMLDAQAASDDDDEMEESNGGNGPSHLDAGGDNPLGQRSSVDRGGVNLWHRTRKVPVSPAPLYKDCLVMYATPPGHFAWRRKNGAWFIQSLCKVLDSRHLGNLSLARALIQVGGYVAKNYQSENPSRPAMHAKKEMPVIESMLVKDVFLKQKRRV
ncbi:caspase-3 [Elysia marginata]|uniref:Caspase-3 n=1 Tax=Elysia marginata TaxID=1093978 RepID=A0AAV4EW99_9GAST|nr:caspase-3 [Elysia marginata]